MNQTRLLFDEIEHTPEGILIKKASIIDGVSGEELRIAKLTSELAEFLQSCEIVLDDYLAIKEMQKKNPAFKKLCNHFNLTL
jgi:hypothetical protein